MIDTLKKINFLITKRQRRGLVILTLLLFIGMVLEVFGLGVLVPAISILLDPDIIGKTPILEGIRHYFSDLSYQSFLMLFLFSIVLVYLVKSLFLGFLTFKQNRFLSNVTAYISNKLFECYLGQPYSFHLNKNASDLIKNIQVEINYLNTFLLSLIIIFIEGGIVLSILATLIYIEPLGAISIGVFYGLLSVVFFQFTKRKLNLWGQLRQSLDAQASKIALEGLGGIKDLIILGKTGFFIDQFSQKNYLKARINANQSTMSQIPRFYLEFISILGLVSFIIIMVAQGNDVATLFTVLGVFVAATFRMIPSLNRIIAAIQSMKYYLPSVDVIYEEIMSSNLARTASNDVREFAFKNTIQFENISFKFKKGDFILKDINLQINKGQTIGIIGESGSGKSTLVDLIIGLHNPSKGLIKIDGVSGLQMNQCWRNKIGYVSQSIYLSDESIKNNIAFGVPKEDVEENKVLNLIKQVQLDSFINSLDQGADTFVGERGIQLSGGQRQRIGIARALYNDPEILILDEATSALDSETEKGVIKSIRKLKGEKTIIMIAHRLSTLNSCDIIYEVKNKSISFEK
jgi:ABC-type bacteriocin/lantibiotic exporter with double-glycine peptidase domain